jgi:hypothetical protein
LAAQLYCVNTANGMHDIIRPCAQPLLCTAVNTGASGEEVLAETIDPEHAPVQSGYDADVCEGAAIGDMALVAEEGAVDAKFGRDRLRGEQPPFDPLERVEEAGQIPIGLLDAPRKQVQCRLVLAPRLQVR